MPLNRQRTALKRLKGKSKIDLLFKKGTVYRNKDLLIRLNSDPSSLSLEIGVSVPKKNFRRAVDRNLIKRLMREALKNIEETFFFSGTCMFLYSGKDIPISGSLTKQMRELLEKSSP